MKSGKMKISILDKIYPKDKNIEEIVKIAREEIENKITK